jgi:hypothetical protein
MVELFGIRKRLNGRFPKDSLRPPFHRAPANTEATSAGLDLAGMFSLFQADIACRAGKVLTARFLKPKPSVCSRPGIRAATPNSLISGCENSFHTSSARFGRSAPRHAKHNA